MQRHWLASICRWKLTIIWHVQANAAQRRKLEDGYQEFMHAFESDRRTQREQPMPRPWS